MWIWFGIACGWLALNGVVALALCRAAARGDTIRTKMHAAKLEQR